MSNLSLSATKQARFERTRSSLPQKESGKRKRLVTMPARNDHETDEHIMEGIVNPNERITCAPISRLFVNV